MLPSRHPGVLPASSRPPALDNEAEAVAARFSVDAPTSSLPASAAPPTTTTTTTMSSAVHAVLQSCQVCRKRKIKCDKALPKCSHCTRLAIDCTYPASQRRGRPRYPGRAKGAVALPAQREDFLVKKVRRLEAIVKTLRGSDVGHDALVGCSLPLLHSSGYLPERC